MWRNEDRKRTFFAIFLFLTLNALGNGTVLRGTIANGAGLEITIYEPINGFTNRSIIQEGGRFKADAAGNFSKQIKILAPGFITLSIEGGPSISLFVEPGKPISVTIKSNDYSKASIRSNLVIGGENAEGNLFYNEFNFHPSAKFADFREYLDSLNYRANWDNRTLEKALIKMLRPFDSLLLNKKITPVFYKMVTYDLRQILITEVTKNVLLSNKIPFDSAVVICDRIYSKYSIEEEGVKGGLNAEPVSYYYAYYLTLKNLRAKPKKDSVLVLKDQSVFVNRDLVPWLYAPLWMREHYWAIDLLVYKKIFPTVYGKNDYATFSSLYPQSKYTKYLRPHYYGIAVSMNLDSSAFIFLNSANIDEFPKSIAAELKGKRLLIDVWGTWCFPCKQEFQFNKKIDSFCIKNNIQRVYIAIEHPSTVDQVKSNVYSFGLAGYHIVANDELKKSLTKFAAGDKEQFSVPLYMIIDENGKVANSNAPRPSQTSELLKELSRVFSIAN